MYIEIIKGFEILRIIAGIKRIHAPYSIIDFCVKPKARKMRLLENQKGESIGSDSPSNSGILIVYRRNFSLLIFALCWRYITLYYGLETCVSRYRRLQEKWQGRC